MTRKRALPYVGYVVNDALGEMKLADMLPNARLVGWQCGFEPMFVAVQSYLPGITLDGDEAEEIARDFLAERKWFAGEPVEADYII